MMHACTECGRVRKAEDMQAGLCFPCRIRTIGFTFRGAHTGRRGWHEATVMGTKKEIYEGARESKVDMERAH
jgi:hypothetical protein